ncbi:hypothetical protein WUBG_01680 [Wuchereria bancrofti]|uniref:EF-hand domain-containing protein n=1 Tax=Wuchereria bancrofti TaxID=6293 RepID=J9EXS0_WUCBA|nr:hypothetical protein WUBG_01680 [Wuchereria bancrofti]
MAYKGALIKRNVYNGQNIKKDKARSDWQCLSMNLSEQPRNKKKRRLIFIEVLDTLPASITMMVDILLEEDEKSSPSSLALQNGDFLLTEQAREMFSLCDHNGKGFVIKMDLARINGMIPSISQQQLELFFDNADIFKTNYITENQFIDNIKIRNIVGK